MDQKVAHPAIRNRHPFGGGRAAAAQFGGDECFAGFLDHGVKHADRIKFEHHHRIGGSKGLHGGNAAGFLFLVFKDVDGSKGNEVQRLAAGMQIKDDVGFGHQMAQNVIGDFLCHRAVGLAGEAAVKVALVNRRCPRCIEECREVHGGQDDDAPMDFGGREFAGQFEQRYQSFVFVTVIAAGQKGGRSIAVANDRNRDHHSPPRGIVTRIGQF